MSFQTGSRELDSTDESDLLCYEIEGYLVLRSHLEGAGPSNPSLLNSRTEARKVTPKDTENTLV
jgi:hypothetical protein